MQAHVYAHTQLCSLHVGHTCRRSEGEKKGFGTGLENVPPPLSHIWLRTRVEPPVRGHCGYDQIRPAVGRESKSIKQSRERFGHVERRRATRCREEAGRAAPPRVPSKPRLDIRNFGAVPFKKKFGADRRLFGTSA